MGKKYHYTDEELLFIEHNWKTHTDKEIAMILGRTDESVGRQRKRFGWIKNNGRPSVESKKNAISDIDVTAFNSSDFVREVSFTNMDKDQRLEIYKQNFATNPRYSTVINELSQEEMRVYIHKYVDFMDSVDTMTPQEEDSLHHMIMTDINISRVRRHIKRTEEESQDGNPLIYGLYDTLEKAEKRFVDYQKILSVTREKRLQKDKEQKETIHTVVQTYRNKMARQELGRRAGLMEIFQEKCKEDMSKYRYLLGGSYE
jgi:hypothetical protein